MKLTTIPGYGQVLVPDDYVPTPPGTVISGGSGGGGVSSATLEQRISDLRGTAPAQGDTLGELYGLLSPGAGTDAWLAAWARLPDVLVRGAITRNADGAATAASVVWPDGTPGSYTGTPSSTVPGAVDAYTITYVPSGGANTRTATQPAMTRDQAGVVTQRPAVTVS